MPAALKQPGLARAFFGFLVGGAFGFGLVVVLREISGLPIFQTEPTGYPHIIVPAITAPLGFLVGIGGFDYWFRWAAGKPTIPDDHSQHGAKSWRDYFKFNTDHKVIGIQYIVTTFFFFFVGGLIAMVMRAELAQPGTQVVDPSVFNGLFSTHAALMIFVFVIPVFAGIANYVLPLMIGAPDMAFPRLNALSFWMLPMAGLLFLSSYLVPGGAFDAGWTGYAPLSTGAPFGQSFFNLGVQFAGRVVGGDRAELPGHDHHHARAGNELLAHAAAGLGEPLDLAARRRGDAVHRRRAVHGPVRPRAGHATSSRRRSAATSSATSTSSGSTRTRPSTS